MPDREKVIKGLEMCKIRYCDECPYDDENSCSVYLNQDALDLLEEQETHDTRESRVFQCEKCGYGIEDIFLNNEYDYPITPVYCPNCGRRVK